MKRLFVLLALGVVLLAGCGRGHPRAADQTSSDPAPSQSAPPSAAHVVVKGSHGQPDGVYVGPMAEAATLDHGGLILKPPARSDTPMASPETAYETCLSGESLCGSKTGPTISLAVVTTPSAGTAGPSGTVVPLIDNELVYVMTWTDYQCVPAGPVRPSGSGSEKPQTCTVLNFISAATGKTLYSADGTEL